MRIDKTFKFGTSQEAWEGINRYFLLQEDEIVQRHGVRTGGQLISFDNILRINLLRVDPEFDFNKHFNYKIQKWTSLVNNYVDLNYLDLVKSEVRKREVAKDNTYNISFIFDNSHGHGKGCLLSLTFTRRPYFPDPILVVQLRSSEVVKRLNFDFLLAERIGQYVYGEDQRMGAIFYLPNAWTQAETSAMYNVHEDLTRVYAEAEEYGDGWTMGPFAKKVLEALEKMGSIKQEEIKYKILLRASRVIQGNITGVPLLAKDMKLITK